MIFTMTRKLNLAFGLLIGLMWMGEVTFGNLGDTAVLGNFRTVHFHAYRLVVWSFIGGALLLTVFAGLFGAYQTGIIEKGLSVGVWSGLISGAITLATIMLVTVIFRDALLLAPSTVTEFARNGQSSPPGPTELARLLYWDAFAGGANHMWIGPFLGVTLGGAGAAIGKRLHMTWLEYRASRS
jgi:hypothetical protein